MNGTSSSASLHETTGEPSGVALGTPISAGSGAGSIDVAYALLRGLIASGVQHLVLSPGSRSGPLVYAAAYCERLGLIQCHMRIDERVASFTALGLAKAGVLRGSPRPVAIVTTSGTAVGHLLAATLEADASDLPLILITADRPFEAQGVGSNQTLGQRGIFGSRVRAEFDVPAATAMASTEIELRQAENVAHRAAAICTGWPGNLPGPIHINIAFREPLVPAANSVLSGLHKDAISPAKSAAGSPFSWSSRDEAKPQASRRVVRSEPAELRLERGPTTVVVAGDMSDPRAAQAAFEFARSGGYPLLAEPSSLARVQSEVTLVDYCTAIEFGLTHADSGATTGPIELTPERIVVAGHPTLSRAVMRTLLNCGAEIVVQSQRIEWFDTTRTACAVAPTITLAAGSPSAADEAFLATWQRASASSYRQGAPADEHTLLTDAAQIAWMATRPDDALVIGASSVIRDLERIAPGAEPGAFFVAQRGLSGIDGTLSVASGLSLSGQFEHVRCVVGDVTFLHDLNALSVGPLEPQPAVDVIVLNDDGGSIFAGLEHANASDEIVRRFFVTPHSSSISQLCAGYNVIHKSFTNSEALQRALQMPRSQGDGVRVFEVVPDPTQC